MKKFKVLWQLLRPMLAAAGITKPSDVGKLIKPLVQILEDLRMLEIQQVKQLNEIHESMDALMDQRTAVLDDTEKALRVRSRLEELLG